MGYNSTDLNFAAFVFLYSDWLTTNMGMIESAKLWTASIFQSLSLKFTSKNEMHNLRYCKLSYSYATINDRSKFITDRLFPFVKWKWTQIKCLTEMILSFTLPLLPCFIFIFSTRGKINLGKILNDLLFCVFFWSLNKSRKNRKTRPTIRAHYQFTANTTFSLYRQTADRQKAKLFHFYRIK